MRVFKFHLWALIAFNLMVPAAGIDLTGRVVSDRGLPVVGERVSVQATAAPISGSARVQPPSYAAQTNNQGIFSVSVPAAGDYSVCVGAYAQQLLNSCEWTFSQSVVPVQTQNNPLVKITLLTAIPITVRLEDPSSLLPKPGATGSTQVMFGVSERHTGFHVARLVGADSNGFTYQVLVPATPPALHLVIQANNVHVADLSNNLVDLAAKVASPAITDVTQLFHYQVVPATAVVTRVP